jgi:hypothetical protein
MPASRAKDLCHILAHDSSDPHSRLQNKAVARNDAMHHGSILATAASWWLLRTGTVLSVALGVWLAGLAALALFAAVVAVAAVLRCALP